MNLIKIVLDNCSPAFSKLIAEFMKSLKDTALKSKNDWDKSAAHIIFLIFGIDFKSK